MYPVLFKIGPFSIYSFGLMMGLGFLTASYILTKELRRKGLDANLGNTITLFALIFGIAGSKMLFLFENWEEFVRDPMNAFSPGGLTWYGGLILATAVIYVYTRRKNLPFWKICDAAAPGLMLGYGIARIGCHLAGDGDYGVPTDLPWATVYAKGTYPPSVAFRDFPEIVHKYGVNGVRLHKFSYPVDHSGIADKNDSVRMTPEGLDRLDYFAAQLKQHGIYYAWSHTFGFQVTPGQTAIGRKAFAQDQLIAYILIQRLRAHRQKTTNTRNSGGR